MQTLLSILIICLVGFPFKMRTQIAKSSRTLYMSSVQFKELYDTGQNMMVYLGISSDYFYSVRSELFYLDFMNGEILLSKNKQFDCSSKDSCQEVDTCNSIDQF